MPCGLPLLAQRERTAEKNPLAGDPEAIAAGKKLFEESCQICHGGDARGGRGPALAAGDFLHGSEEEQIFQNIREGIAGTQMPAFELLPNEIWQLVSYIRSLSGTVAREEVPGDAAAGESIFFGKGACTACHQINGRGSRLGPDLSSIGRWRAQALRETILTRTSVRAANAMCIVKTRDAANWLRVIPSPCSCSTPSRNFTCSTNELASALRRESLMPDDYGRLSQTGVDNTVVYSRPRAARSGQTAANRRRWTGYTRLASRDRKTGSPIRDYYGRTSLGPEADHGECGLP